MSASNDRLYAVYLFGRRAHLTYQWGSLKAVRCTGHIVENQPTPLRLLTVDECREEGLVMCVKCEAWREVLA